MRQPKFKPFIHPQQTKPENFTKTGNRQICAGPDLLINS
jgi:hypothetical protein